jgi:hypothetical protein
MLANQSLDIVLYERFADLGLRLAGAFRTFQWPDRTRSLRGSG